jgi:hypothetical protein
MSEVVAALVIYAFGFLSALAFIALLQRRTRSISPSAHESIALRLRAVRRSRVAKVEQRVDALERAVSQRAVPEHRGGVQGSPRPITDGDAIAGLLALGYRRSEAVARLAAIADGGSTEERVRAALQAR